MKRFFCILVTLCALLSLLPTAQAASDAWDGTVDISWYDPQQDEFYLSTPAELAGLAALINGMADPTCPRIIGDTSYLKSIRVDDYMLVGAGGGNVSDTVYTSGIDFAYKTVYLTADLDMGGRYDSTTSTWSGPNWTPIGGKFPMKPSEVKGDCMTIDTRFNGVLDGQGHTISNLYCDRYAAKGFPYSMAVGLVGYLGGESDTNPVITTDFSDGWQPAVRNLVLESGSILGRRMVGGIVGRVAETANGVIVENCANFATVKSTDAKGVGGIVGSAWGEGMVRSCYNAGYITTTYSSPAGGIVGTNEGMDIYNCYNVGTIDTNGQSRGRAIGSHDTGVYTVNNCYYLAGTGDDASSAGYYKGISRKISVNVYECSAAQLKSAETLQKLNANGTVFVPDTKNINGGYPVLWYQNGVTGGKCSITLKQSSGGEIALIGSATVAFGETVTLASTPDAGYALEYFTVNGEAIASNFFVATEDVTVGAVFKKLRTATITIPESDDYYISVTRDGLTLSGSGLQSVTAEPLRSGDTLVEGNTLHVLLHGYDAVPADVNLEYIDAFDLALTGTEQNADGSYTVTGEGNVSITATRKTQEKTWLSLADTTWYTAGQQESYTLTTPEQLAGLAYLVNSSGCSFSGATIRLGCDISLQNTDGTMGQRLWIPIGSNANKPFRGMFDGAGYGVYDLTISSAASYAALFGYCEGATIKNLSVYGAVEGKANASYAAGIAAYMNGGSVSGCQNYATIAASGTYAGGIAAFIRSGASVENCFNYGDITAKSGLGGLVGISDSADDAIRSSANFAPVTSTGNNPYGTGGIVGRIGGEVSGCVNYGAVSGTDRYTGGIVGYAVTKNGSKITLCANEGSVSSSNTMATAALGGIVGYGQFLTLSGAEHRGSVRALSGFVSTHIGDTVARESATPIKVLANDGEIPAYTPQAAKRLSGKSEFTVTFVADGVTVATRTYTQGMTSVHAPSVPEKTGYHGTWSPYTLSTGDITVRALYRPTLVRGGDTITKSGAYLIAWNASGTITIAPNLTVTLLGENGGSEGFEELHISVGAGSALTLGDTTITSEHTMLTLAGSNTLTLRGASRLVSLTDAQDNAQPSVRVLGILTIAGDGTLYVSAGIRNTAIFVENAGSTVTLSGGTVTVYKQDLLGFTGGAFEAHDSTIIVDGGTLRGHTASDNVAVLCAKETLLKRGTLAVQAERSPYAVLGTLNATGGTLSAYGHSGLSAAASAEYRNEAAIEHLRGTASFADFLPFGDVFVSDDYYDAVAYCYAHKLFNGVSATSFAPDTTMTRGMFVTVLHRLAGLPAITGENQFTDLTQSWYRDAVAWAVAQGITNGTSQTTFSPNAAITREQAAVFLSRYARAQGESLSVTADELDHGIFSAWAEADMLWAMHAGLFSGAEDVLSEPSGNASRALLATMLCNYSHSVQ